MKEVESPVPGENEVLCGVRAASVSPGDRELLAGDLFSCLPLVRLFGQKPRLRMPRSGSVVPA